MDIEGLKKRKELLENNLKQINDRIRSDTENSLRVQGALLDVSEIIKEDEEKKEETEAKEKEKVEKKKK